LGFPKSDILLGADATDTQLKNRKLRGGRKREAGRVEARRLAKFLSKLDCGFFLQTRYAG